MHLKKITLSGFKSFADRITVNFDKGITGVVGPNGSGKSNIIDAVRWVMGEQNAKHLRGHVATDIIFAGSSKRKAVGMAEVSLVFDNRDASAFCPPEYQHEPEITISRRLYSDGSRDYLLNKKPCRLRDVTHFFTTTGLGGRSYSMIQQGQVDRILNAKPEDVREILEEAAGTTIYKIRRQGAQKKLDITQENLSRLEDLIEELDRQRKSLSEQVEKAKAWRGFSEELKEVELTLLAHQYHNARGNLKGAEEERESCQTQQAEITKKIAEHDARLSEFQGELDSSDPGLEALHEQVSLTRESIARSEDAIRYAGELETSGQKRLEEIKVEVDSETENLKVIEKQIEGAVEEVAAASTKFEDLTAAIETFQDEVDAVDEMARQFEGRKDDCEDQLREIERLLDSNSVRCESVQRNQAEQSREITATEERIEILEAELGGLKKDLAAIRERAAGLQEGLDEELEKKSTIESRMHERQAEIQQQRTTRDEVKERYFDEKARANSMQEMVASASSLQESLEKLAEYNPDSADLIVGKLTDFLHFAGQGQSALPARAAASLERWLERIVVRNVEDLSQLGRQLDAAEAGGFPVHLLNAQIPIATDEIKSWVERLDLTPMSEYIETTGNAPGELRNLLDRMYLHTALAIDSSDIAQMPRGAILFTSGGTVFSGLDSIYAGAPGTRGVLSWKAELEELQKSCKEAEGLLAETQSRLDTLEHQHNSDQLELRDVDSVLSQSSDEVSQITNEVRGMEQQANHKDELRHAAEQQLQAFKDAVSKAATELAELGEARIDLGKERVQIEREIEDITSESDTVRERKEEVYELHQSRKLELAKIEVRKQALEQSFEQTRAQQERLQGSLTRRYEEQSRIELDIQEAKDRATTCQQEIADLIRMREKLQDELAEKREENAELIDSIRGEENALKDLRDQLHKCDRKLGELEVRDEKARLGAAGFAEQALEKYQIELQDHPKTTDDDYDVPKASRVVGRLRSKMETLGAINMLAIEEYDELMERHGFISAQREEILSSMAILEEALEEIDETSKKRFLETFYKIDEEFGKLFPILFPTGQASLVITDESDPLNAGVEIMCQLPGKKQQRMNLFSGGEKALTAISLIFALLKTKPTPFCFLDEVDAPLDEANVGRYNRVLEALSERFQFIVITHNRRTMEVLDTLYGVVMQEPGVSKVVGIDLQRELPEHLKKSFKDEKPAGTPPPSKERTVEGATAG